MTARGKLIALEGIDGSGKRTQLELLSHELAARGLETLQISFPRYGTSFGNLAGRYLNGDFGKLETIDSHLSALLYAGDRLEAKPEIESALAAGKIVLADRYVGSNLAHQSERVPAAGREAFLTWLKYVEYDLYGLPVEDLVVYLRVPAVEAQRLVGMKAARTYTSLSHDIQEADVAHLKQTAAMYDRLATEPNWVRIDCTDAETGVLDSPEKIHSSVMNAVESRILSQRTTK